VYIHRLSIYIFDLVHIRKSWYIFGSLYFRRGFIWDFTPYYLLYYKAWTEKS